MNLIFKHYDFFTQIINKHSHSLEKLKTVQKRSYPYHIPETLDSLSSISSNEKTRSLWHSNYNPKLENYGLEIRYKEKLIGGIPICVTKLQARPAPIWSGSEEEVRKRK